MGSSAFHSCCRVKIVKRTLPVFSRNGIMQCQMFNTYSAQRSIISCHISIPGKEISFFSQVMPVTVVFIINLLLPFCGIGDCLQHCTASNTRIDSFSLFKIPIIEKCISIVYVFIATIPEAPMIDVRSQRIRQGVTHIIIKRVDGRTLTLVAQCCFLQKEISS